MGLTWRDGAATIMTAGAVGLYLCYLAGASIPYLLGPGAYGGAVLVMGLAACVLGGGGVQVGARARWLMGLARALGIVALVAGVAVLITGNDAVLALLVGTTVALWLVTTARHAFGDGRGRDASGPPHV